MKKLIRTLSVAFAAVLTVVVFAGCGGAKALTPYRDAYKAEGYDVSKIETQKGSDVSFFVAAKGEEEAGIIVMVYTGSESEMDIMEGMLSFVISGMNTDIGTNAFYGTTARKDNVVAFALSTETPMEQLQEAADIIKTVGIIAE